MQLSDFFAEHPRVAVAFSGGVDSAYLLYAAKTAGCDVHAYFIHSQFQPRFELDDTQRFVEMLHSDRSRLRRFIRPSGLRQ